MPREYTFDAFIHVFAREIELDYAWDDVMEIKRRVEETTKSTIYVYEENSDWWFNILLHLCPRHRTMERWFCAENEYLITCFGLERQEDEDETKRYYLDELYEKLKGERFVLSGVEYNNQRMEGVLRHQRIVGVHTERPLIGINKRGELVPIQRVPGRQNKRKKGTEAAFVDNTLLLKQRGGE